MVLQNLGKPINGRLKATNGKAMGDTAEIADIRVKQLTLSDNHGTFMDTKWKLIDLMKHHA